MMTTVKIFYHRWRLYKCRKSRPFYIILGTYGKGG
jgi:hypothetical protein